MTATDLPGVVVLISGSGSNLQALIDQADAQRYRIVAVISNRADAYGLTRAEHAGIPHEVLSHKQFGDRDSYDRALIELIDRYQPDFIALAGFMRILTQDFVDHYLGRMLNIHPSLLPRHRGLHTHRAALESGDREHGASVHFVTPELDGGPVVLQARVPVLAGDTEQTLAARVLEQEHRIYPQAMGWLAQGRVSLKDGQIRRRQGADPR